MHVITPFTQTVKVGRNIRYIANDSGAPEQLHALSENLWKTNHNNAISLGFQTEPHWFTTSLKTETDVSKYWILELANPMIDHISVYLYKEGELQNQWHTGDALPFYQRPVETTRFQFPLELEDDSTYTIYMRIDSTEALELPLLLVERFSQAIMSDHRSLVDGIFLGFLMIMVAYSLAIFVILRDKSYLYYSFYVSSMLMFFLSQQGLLYQYAFPNSPQLQHYIIPWVSLAIYLSTVLFFQSFLNISENAPTIWKLNLTLLVVHTILCISVLFFTYQIVLGLIATNVAFSMVLIVTILMVLSKRGSHSAQIVLAGWGMLALCILLFVFSRTGIFYNDFLANYGLRIGVTLEIIVFSYALSFRIHQEREQKEWALNKINSERSDRIQAQELALAREVELRETKEHALQLEIHHRENLEKLVDERTADLERTMIDLEKANQELEQLSSKDALTGLFNRRMFDTSLEQLWNLMLEKSQPLSLLVLDADHFKHVNDNRGHLCGDMVLQEMAKLLQSILHRPSDVITRYGGEEFAVLLPNTPDEGAVHLAELIVEKASQKMYMWEEKTFHVTVSVGVHSLVPDGNNDPMQLIDGADQALYQAKESGRNRYMLYELKTKKNINWGHPTN